MRFTPSLSALVGLTAARSVRPPILAQEPLPPSTLHFPTVHESAVLARRILHLTSIGDLVSQFPPSSSTHDTTTTSSSSLLPQELLAFENRPHDVAGSPIGLVEYYADCEPTTGNPTLLAIDIATPYKNAAAGSNISLTVRWWPDQKTTYLSNPSSDDDDDDDLPTPHTPMALPRMSLHGYLEPIPASELASHDIPSCFTRTHPDAALWQPGGDVHASTYVRLVVEHVYWLGGFGDRARIQWLPIEEWRGVTMEEVAAARLPGEEKEKGCGGRERLEEMPVVSAEGGREGSLERWVRDWWDRLTAPRLTLGSDW
ncbi:Pyridoxamine 5'-phosphate oxidase [Teratosphaeria destructans]|uniref:Pyridoxamine 5'-phosphate oxidase n=1 Tax=Teratosphaeria destructans TaxID=418781 RepID=A0A9W7W759_9PEZI|nr:Pyridoxamine 5'-phosphate oxidase [Teratosphaeria destructans]